MTNYMELAHSRVERAWEHIQQFISEADSFLETNPYRVIREVNTEASGYLVRYRFKADRQPPVRLRFLVGDAVHNLRSTLDNLVWSLGQISGEQSSSQLAFPVCIKEERFNMKILPMLRRLPPDAQSLIENLQPYNRRDDPEGHPLYILNRLWNDDKHETPLVVRGFQSSTGLGIRRGGQVHIVAGKLSVGATGDDAEVMSLLMPDSQSVANLKPAFTADIAFDKVGPARGAIVRKLLVDLHDFVRDEVVEKFAPFFPA